MNGSTSRSDAAATTRGDEQPRAARPIAASQIADRPEEELDRAGEAEREPRRELRVAVAPDEREQHAEKRCEVRDADLADHLRPQRERAVHAPVADADDPQRAHEAREPDERDRPVGGAGGEHRQRRDEERGDRRPDEVVPVPDRPIRAAGRGSPSRGGASPRGRARCGSRRRASRSSCATANIATATTTGSTAKSSKLDSGRR